MFCGKLRASKLLNGKGYAYLETTSDVDVIPLFYLLNDFIGQILVNS